MNGADILAKADVSALSRVLKLLEPVVKTIDPDVIVNIAFAE
ncbi:MAG: hypothetical protein R2912_04825 [Eubacteriales bacterium]